MNSVWTEVFLGIIAFSTLAVALVLVGVFLAAWMVVRHVARLLDRIEAEMKPIFGQLNAIATDAARAASLAGAQVERADHLVTEATERLGQAVATAQHTLLTPVREGRALLSALGAGVRAAFDFSGRRHQSSSDDDDALFG